MGFRDKAKAAKTAEIEIDGEVLTIREPTYALSVEANKLEPAKGMAKLFIACVYQDGAPVWTEAQIDEVLNLPVSYAKQLDAAIGQLAAVPPKKS
ncbi:MAG TPA: hypothetical protein VF598_01680 [Hymenobacter sp.]|jgi:hypothetical protein